MFMCPPPPTTTTTSRMGSAAHSSVLSSLLLNRMGPKEPDQGGRPPNCCTVSTFRRTPTVTRFFPAPLPPVGTLVKTVLGYDIRHVMKHPGRHAARD